MATHSSVLAWRIPGTGEPGGLPSMGLHRVGHDWSDLAAAAAAAAGRQYGCESWKAEWEKFDGFELWYGEDSWDPLDSKEIKPFNPKGNQPWIFTRRTEAEAEAPVLWPPDVKSQLTGKGPEAGNDWRQKKKATEDEMVGWHQRLNGHEFEQIPGDSEGEESLVCCSSWGHEELDTM